MAFFSLPDEIILNILGELQTEPDILLNVAALVCNQFRRLSYDCSLWRTFSVPGHWSYDTTLRFLQFHPAGTCVQDLACSTGFVNHLGDLDWTCDSLCIPNVMKLSIVVADTLDLAPLPNRDSLKHFPELFPNLTFLKTSETMSHTFEQLHRLVANLPDVKLELGTISSAAVLLMPALCKETFRLSSAEALEGFTKNAELFELSNSNLLLDMSQENEFESFSEIELHLRRVGHRISELKLDCFIHFNELQVIAKECRGLRKLHLHSVAGCEELWDLENMVCLRDLYLKTAGFAFDDLEVSDEDTIKIVSSCPGLETLAVGIPNNISKPIVYSLPLSLRSLEFFHRIISKGVSRRKFIASMLQGVQEKGIRLKSITGCDCVAAVMSEIVSEGEDTELLDNLEDLHLTSRRAPGIDRPTLSNILQHLIGRKIQIKTLHLYGFYLSFSQNILKIITGYSCLRNLSLHVGCDSNILVSPEHLVPLAQNLPHLERLKIIHIYDEKWNLERRTIFTHLDPLMVVLKQFKRLKFFSLDGFTLSSYGEFRMADREKAEQKLNTHYGPWRHFTLDARSLHLTQCPPAYRA